jgi:hypothetical protein
MSASAIYRSVAIYELWQRLGPGATWKHVGACHLRAVLGLPAPDQEEVLLQAERERLTVRQLDELVAGIRAQRSDRRGRPPRRPLARALHDVHRAIEELDVLLSRVLPDGDDYTALLSELAQARARVDAIGARLRGAEVGAA